MDRDVLDELKTLRDELIVQSHLFSMEIKDRWEELEKVFSKFDDNLKDVLIDFGNFNEDFWVGNKSEIEELIEEYKEIKKHLK